MSLPTLLLLHAHPDDEAVLTGSLMAKAQAAGMRMIVVYGTKGDAGETNKDLGGESLGDRRIQEAHAACDDLGVARVEWLPYADSGMDGTETTNNPDAFSNADAATVAAELATLLADETIDVVVGYDANGTYGHPDHKMVHRLALAAGPALDATWVVEATYCREHIAALPSSDGTLDLGFAAAEADLTHFVRGEELMLAKLKALSNHASQVPDDFDPDNPKLDFFRERFGVEWFIAHPLSGATEFEGPLAELFEPKAEY